MPFLFNFRRLASFLFLTLLLLTVVSCSDVQSEDDVKILRGATLFDGTGAPAIDHSVIVVRNGKIDCVGEEGNCPSSPNAEVIDVTGKYITPGLIDAHVHFFQTGFFDGRPDALDLRDTYPYSKVAAYQKEHPQRYYNSYLCSGITGVYDVGGFSWSIDFQESAEENPNAPHVAAAGPLITPSKTTIINTPADKTLVNLNSKETGRQIVEYLSALESTGLKLWQLRPENEEYMSRVKVVAEEAEKHNKELIAHATSLRQAKEAVKYGASLLVHSVSDKQVDQEFLDMTKKQGTIYTPTLIVGSGYIMAYRAAAGIAPFPIDDPNGCIDPKTKELLNNASKFKDHPRFTEAFRKRLRSFNPKEDRVSETDLENLKRVYEAGIPIAVGTDAGNPGTLHGPSIYEEMEAMQSAGIPAKDLIVMATRNGARAMQRGDDFGTLEPGKIANLIILEEDPSADIENMRTITRTMIKGEIKKVKNIGEK